jgi:glucose/mannose transport system permease protein
LLLVSPSIFLVAVFVYGLIGWNVKVSFSDWRQAQETSGFDTGAYGELFPGEVGKTGTYVKAVATGDQPLELTTDPAWIIDLHHALLFTVVFVLGALLMGAFLAFLLDKGVKGEGFFRAVYLFPMAVSFIASGIVWRWLMNPAPGDRASGLNIVFDKAGLDFLVNDWWQAPNWGIAAIALPAIWQLTGYIMALYLAGFRGVPDDLREAARMDGASEWRVYRHVVFPHLRPVTLSALIIIGHISIKVFDLIVAIAGKQIVADMPAVYMWQLVFDARDAAKGAAIATLLLIGISVLIVPYLIFTVRSERRA